MYNNINLMSKLIHFKNLKLWDFSRELLVLDEFKMEGNKKMTEKEMAQVHL